MKLKYNFNELWSIAKELSDSTETFTIGLKSNWKDPEYEKVKSKLQTGLSVLYDELTIENQLLTYKGHNVLLYIEEQPCSVSEVFNNPSKGYKVHFTDCDHLNYMRSNNRLERYIATTNTSGNLPISSIDRFSNKRLHGKARLHVCKKCLAKLNYKQFTRFSPVRKNEFVANFNYEELFKTYSSAFKSLPSRTHASTSNTVYSEDWVTISRNAREKANWRCAKCGVDLSQNRSLLHTHHRNGNKEDNSESNLMALCVLCHSTQFHHNHMIVTPDQRITIQRLRRDQGIRSLT